MPRLVSENNIKIRVYKNKIMIKDGFNMLEKDMSSESTKKVIPFEKVGYTWRWTYDSVNFKCPS